MRDVRYVYVAGAVNLLNRRGHHKLLTLAALVYPQVACLNRFRVVRIQSLHLIALSCPTFAIRDHQTRCSHQREQESQGVPVPSPLWKVGAVA